MENIDIAPFYVNHDIVANCTYSFNGKVYFKKGDEFRVKSIFKKCCYWVVDIGIYNPYGGTTCDCGSISLSYIFHFRSSRFSPKIEIKEFISMKQFVEEKLELISAN